MMKKLLIIFSLIFLTSCTYIQEIQNDITGEVVKENVKLDSGSIESYFCPRDNCEEKLVNLIDSSQKIHCAFFELDLEDVINSLKEKDYFVIIDDSNLKDVQNLSNTKPDNRNALMHNKFCVFDDKTVSTGSFNPTFNGNARNNNNLVIINSKVLSENYEYEFQSFMQDKFGKDEQVKNPKIILNNEILIENYFCPEDECEQHVYDLINKAEDRVYFMTFSFTSDRLGDLIIEKSKDVKVKGIFEHFQSNSEYSQYSKMLKSNLSVITDNNPSFMHHKVFIVDDIIITGSYNPSSSGNKKNDENIVIIYDRETVDKFLEEFDYVWNLK